VRVEIAVSAGQKDRLIHANAALRSEGECSGKGIRETKKGGK
jgi:hypothetical protein